MNRNGMHDNKARQAGEYSRVARTAGITSYEMFLTIGNRPMSLEQLSQQNRSVL